MLAFAIGGAMLYAVYLQMVSIVNILPTKGNYQGLSPYQTMYGNNVELEQVCPHYPLDMVLVAKKNNAMRLIRRQMRTW